MGRNLHWSIILASEDQRSAGQGLSRGQRPPPRGFASRARKDQQPRGVNSADRELGIGKAEAHRAARRDLRGPKLVPDGRPVR